MVDYSRMDRHISKKIRLGLINENEIENILVIYLNWLVHVQEKHHKICKSSIKFMKNKSITGGMENESYFETRCEKHW